MGDRWEKQSRKPEQVEDNAKALGVSLEEADIVQMKKRYRNIIIRYEMEEIVYTGLNNKGFLSDRAMVH